MNRTLPVLDALDRRGHEPDHGSSFRRNASGGYGPRMEGREPGALAALIRRRWRVGVTLTAVMMTAYFGFILLVAFGKDTAGTLLADDRISVGILLGAAVIVVAPVLTAIYVRWANRVHDPAIAKLREPVP